MTVLAGLKTPGHVTEALVHANQASDSLTDAKSYVDAARSLAALSEN